MRNKGNLGDTGEDLTRAREKIRHYCAYQDRCRSEVLDRLRKLGVSGQKAYALLEELENETYVDEARYAKSFARGKFHSNRWGRLRIRRELRQRKIPATLIESGLGEISEEEYRSCLEKILRSRMAGGEGSEDLFIRKNKTAQYAYRRGFEPELTWSILHAEFPDST